MESNKKLSIHQGFSILLKTKIFNCSLISWKVFIEFECKMPTCSGPRLSKLEQGTSTETKKDVLLLDFPQNAGVRWNKNCPPPNQCKGIYTWTSTPRALYQNRKLIRDNLNLQRWVNTQNSRTKKCSTSSWASLRFILLRRESYKKKWVIHPETLLFKHPRREV